MRICFLSFSLPLLAFFSSSFATASVIYCFAFVFISISISVLELVAPCWAASIVFCFSHALIVDVNVDIFSDIFISIFDNSARSRPCSVDVDQSTLNPALHAIVDSGSGSVGAAVHVDAASESKGRELEKGGKRC